MLAWIELFSLLLWLLDAIVVKVLYDKDGTLATFFVDVYKERIKWTELWYTKKAKNKKVTLKVKIKLSHGYLEQEKQFKSNQAEEIYSILTPFVNRQESFNILRG